MMSKAEIRREVRARMAQLYGESERGPVLRKEHSRKICEAIREHASWRKARMICAFVPMGSEPLIAPLWEQENTRAFCFPCPLGEALKLLRIDDRDALRRADWKMDLTDFAAATVVSQKEPDLLLVPGVAFTAAGARLGRGRGYYDRLLAEKPPAILAIGVCYGVQMVADLPREAHDIEVDAIATEDGVIEGKRPPFARC